MARQLGAQREQHLRLGPVDDRNQHGRRPRRLHAGALPQRGIEIEIAARRLRPHRVVERRRHVEA